MMEPEHTYRLRKAAGNWWLLDMSQNGKHYKKPVALNDSAAEIWQLFEKLAAPDKIAEELSARHGIPFAEASVDVTEFLTALGVI